MKQPELGRRISELRTAKGLTQEELVEKCNISVRTIQRIENGEVTPRSYTIKTILDALEYDLSKISDDDTETLLSWFKKFMLIDIDINKPSDYLIKQLNIAWIFGIFYFLLGFFEGAAEYFRFEEARMIFSNSFYVVMKLLVLITFVFFQRGFIMIGGLFKNDFIKILSIILIFCTILSIGYDIASIFYNSIEYKFILVGFSLTFGVIGILYGVSLYRLQKSIGKIARYAGILEIIMGCLFLTVALAFVGFILSIPIEIFEIIIIFKTIQIIKSKQEESNFA